MSPLSTEPNITGPDPYLTYMEEQDTRNRADFEARMAAKHRVEFKSGIQVTGRPVVLHGAVRQWSDEVATHEHADNTVAEVTR